jgi:hypothetical protein
MRSGIKPRRADRLGGVGVVRRTASRYLQKEIPVTTVQRNGTITPIVPSLSTTYAAIRFDPKDRRTFIGG